MDKNSWVTATFLHFYKCFGYDFYSNANLNSNSNTLLCHCYVPQSRNNMILERVFSSNIHSRKTWVIVNIALCELSGRYYQIVAQRHGDCHCTKTYSQGRIYMGGSLKIDYTF